MSIDVRFRWTEECINDYESLSPNQEEPLKANQEEPQDENLNQLTIEDLEQIKKLGQAVFSLGRNVVRITAPKASPESRINLLKKIDKAEKTVEKEINSKLKRMKGCIQILKENGDSIQSLAKFDDSFETYLNSNNKNKPQIKEQTKVNAQPQLIKQTAEEQKADKIFAELVKKEVSFSKKPRYSKKNQQDQDPSLNHSEKSSEPLLTCSPTSKPSILPIQMICQKSLLEQITQLNYPSISQYRLSSRVKRWVFADTKAARLFIDYKDKKASQPYAEESEEVLKTQIEFHKVGWAQKIISSDLGEMYAFNHQHSENKKGKSLFASIHIGSKHYIGLIVLGIDDEGVIYHAQFRLFRKKDLIPSHVAELLNLPSSMEVEEKKDSEDDWKHTSQFIFSLVEKNIIEIRQANTVASCNLQETVYYRVYPLSN